MYRRRSLLQAEKAATEGQGGEEFDTQACENLQEHILSVEIRHYHFGQGWH